RSLVFACDCALNDLGAAEGSGDGQAWDWWIQALVTSACHCWNLSSNADQHRCNSSRMHSRSAATAFRVAARRSFGEDALSDLDVVVAVVLEHLVARSSRTWQRRTNVWRGLTSPHGGKTTKKRVSMPQPWNCPTLRSPGKDGIEA